MARPACSAGAAGSACESRPACSAGTTGSRGACEARPACSAYRWDFTKVQERPEFKRIHGVVLDKFVKSRGGLGVVHQISGRSWHSSLDQSRGGLGLSYPDLGVVLDFITRSASTARSVLPAGTGRDARPARPARPAGAAGFAGTAALRDAPRLGHPVRMVHELLPRRGVAQVLQRVGKRRGAHPVGQGLRPRAVTGVS